MTQWIPRGEDPATREVLVDGVPSYMKPALLEFLKPHFARASSVTDTWFFRRESLMMFDLVARLRPSYVDRLDGTSWPGFFNRLPEEELLDVADWVVHQNNRAVAQSLDRILEAAGSAWTIGKRNRNDGLLRRMPESVQVAVDAAISRSSSGRLLGEAWAAAYGRVPDPEEAYEKAVKAVEEAAAPVVSPKNSLTTLGTIIRDMKAQQDWAIDLPGRATDVAIPLAEALWSGQESRHGGNGYRRPSQGEAETAVILSVTLVQLFSSGSLHRRG